jgi:hypothetical protein
LESPQSHPDRAKGSKSQIEFEKAEENRIVLSPDHRRPHPLIKNTKDLLSKRKPDEFGRGKTQAPESLDIQVTQSSLRRAFLFMDTPIKACEKRGFEVKAVKWYREVYQTQIVVCGEEIRIRLDEKAKKVVPQPTGPEPERFADKWRWEIRYRPYFALVSAEFQLREIATRSITRN